VNYGLSRAAWFLLFTWLIQGNQLSASADSIESELSRALDLTRTEDLATRRLGWEAVLNRVNQIAPTGGDSLPKALADSIENSAFETASKESLTALQGFYQASPERRIKLLSSNPKLDGSGNSKDRGAVFFITAFLAEFQLSLSGPERALPRPLGLGEPPRPLTSLVAQYLYADKLLGSTDIQRLIMVVSGAPSYDENTSAANQKNLRLMAAMAISRNPKAKQASSLVQLPTSSLQELILSGTNDSLKDPLAQVLGVGCKNAYAHMLKTDPEALSSQSIVDHYKNDLVDGGLKSTDLKHQQLLTGIKPESFLRAAGLEVNLNKSAPSPVERCPNLRVHLNSSIEIGKYVGLSYVEEVQTTSTPLLPVALQQFAYGWFPWMEPGGAGKLAFFMRMGFQTNPESNWIATKLPHLPDDQLKKVTLTCESGCLTKQAVAQEATTHWQVFSVLPGAMVELRLESGLEDVRPMPFHSTQIRPETRWKTAPWPDGRFFVWALDFDPVTSGRFAESPIYDLAAASPVITPTQPVAGQVGRPYGLLSYAANLQRALSPTGYLFNSNDKLIAESAARSLARLHIVHLIARRPPDPGPEEETENAPWKQRYSLLRQSMPLLAKRVFDFHAPLLEREIPLITSMTISARKIQQELRQALTAERELSMEEKWALLGRSSKTLKIDQPEVIKNKELLTVALLGAAEESVQLLNRLESQLSVDCAILRRLQFEGRSPLPSAKANETILELCP
jgi:hypothetical protein